MNKMSVAPKIQISWNPLYTGCTRSIHAWTVFWYRPLVAPAPSRRANGGQVRRMTHITFAAMSPPVIEHV